MKVKKIKETNYPIGYIGENKMLVTKADFKRWVVEITETVNLLSESLNNQKQNK